MPGFPGSTPDGKSVGDRLHQLLSLARALTAAAIRTTAIRTTAASTGTGADTASATPPTDPPTEPPADLPVGGGSAALVTAALGVELESFSDAAAVEWAQCIEQLNRFTQALLVQSAGDLARRVQAGRFIEDGASNPTALLVQSLLLSKSEANRRLHLAKRFFPTTDPLTTVVTPARQPVLGSAFLSGDLSPDQAMMAAHYLDDAIDLSDAGRIPVKQRHDIEQTLTTYAKEEAPDHLRRVGQRILNHLDPDGQQPTEGALLAKQGIFFRQPRRGLVHFEGHMTVLQYEQSKVYLDWANNKQKTHPNNTGGGTTSGPSNGDETTQNSTFGSTSSSSGGGSSRGGGLEGATPGQESLFSDLATLKDLVNNSADHDGTEHDGTGVDSTPNDGARKDGSRAPAGFEAETMPPSAPAEPATTAMTAPKPAPSLWLNPATDPAGIGWEKPPDSDTDAAGEDLSWLWNEPRPVTPIGWDQTPDTTTGTPLPGAPLPGTGTGATDGAGVEAAPGVTGVEGDRSPWPENTENTEGVENVEGVRMPATGSKPDPGAWVELEGWDPIDPNSTDTAVKDRRTHAQRLLDGLIDCLKLAARTGKLPTHGGLKTQLIITTTQEDLDRHRQDKSGTALAPFSGPVPLTMFEEELCDADITHLYFGKGQEILNVGRTQRLFTRAQRKILIARDLGCSFPDCTATAYQCEGHHIIPWGDGGETSIANACLLCSYHHHLIHRTDWTIKLINGTPYFTPPYHLDPSSKKRRNNYHHSIPTSPYNQNTPP